MQRLTVVARSMLLVAAAGLFVLSCSRQGGTPAQIVGVTMAHFDDNYLTIVRNAMANHAKSMPGVALQFTDAQGDVAKQLSQIQNFVTQGVAAIIVCAADTSATPRMTAIAREAGVPLVYVNRRPAEEKLPGRVVFVGSDDLDAGRLEMEELARLMNRKGRVAIMVGELASNGAQLRTRAVEEVVAKYPDITVIEKQVGNFQRERGLDLMNNWLTAGAGIDAVASNNDEMAIGAIMAIRQAGLPAGKILVGGVDATPEALAEVEKGTLAVTVFQNGRAQAERALDAAIKLSRNEPVESFVWIPFELVTKDNYRTFAGR